MKIIEKLVLDSTEAKKILEKKIFDIFGFNVDLDVKIYRDTSRHFKVKIISDLNPQQRQKLAEGLYLESEIYLHIPEMLGNSLLGKFFIPADFDLIDNQIYITLYESEI